MSDPTTDFLAAPEQQQVARLLRQAQSGDCGSASEAAQRLLPLVYEQLKQLARQRMSEERSGHTLQATALVHEAYVRLVGADSALPWADRSQFFFAAAEAMRRILIDHARARGTSKRGGKGRQRVPLSNVLDLAAASEEQIPQILSLDEAVSRLQKLSESVAAVVRLRFYAGLSIEETAAAMGVSTRTVQREWTYARAWLARELACDAE
jgi:RNA polymerase sigma factor (TIGR02999 family)